MLILSGKSDAAADAKKIGPVLIFERLWQETWIKAAISRLLRGRRFEFDVERAVFLTVLHRLMVSGTASADGIGFGSFLSPLVS